MAAFWADLTWRWKDRQRGFLRQEMLTFYLLLVGGNTLAGYLLSPTESVRQANLWVMVLALVLLAVVRVRSLFGFVVHAVTALTVGLVVFTAAQTGGINSTAVVWLNVLAVPVLLLLGPRATLAWIAIELSCVLLLLLATRWGWVASHESLAHDAALWAFLNHLMALGNLMVGVRLYEYLHKVQLRKLQEGNEALKRTHQALLQAQAHKDEFVAAVGHELRTPMNAILGFNGVLRREFADQPEQREVVEHIRRSTEHLLRVVNDILDFSQLQAGQLHLAKADFELPQLLADLSHRYADRARDKGLQLTIQADAALPQRLHGDRQRLLQVLNNLLDNAIKFTAHGRVQVRAMRHGPCLRFEVQDTGRGIAHDRQPLIFRRFEHADLQTNRAYGGTGLGLALSEGLVALSGGRIGVDSREGQGATFWLELPFEEAHANARADAAAVPDLKDEALHILVVDDNAVNLMVAQLQLQKCWPNARITTADSGPKALVLLDTQRFDIALIDMVMPDMDGMQVTRQIRAQFPVTVAHMPVLALTANTNPQDRARCLAAGMSDVLHKPMDIPSLVSAVHTAIDRARSST